MAEMLRPIPVDLEPKRKNRFVLEFPADLDFAEWMVQTASRPAMNINVTEIDYMNTKTYVAGKVEFETMDITFIDVIGPSTSQKIMTWIRQTFDSATGRMGYATNYKKNLTLKLLDPAGEEVEKWVIYGAFVINANFNDLDHSSDELTDVTITLRYDRAVLVN